MNKMSQNIFTYATSELSQDAFISLLISWFDSKELKLKKISENFIVLLLNLYKVKDLDNKKIKTVSVKKQYEQIDIYIEVEYENEIISFIIEDKTWTEPHSKQLEKYVKKIELKIKKEKNKYKRSIVKILFKTGYITEKDEGEAKINKYVILDIKKMYDFLTSQDNIDNIIFNDYIDYIKETFYDKLYIDGNKKKLINYKVSDLKNSYAQYELIKSIKKETNKDKAKKYIEFTVNGVSYKTWWSFYEEKIGVKTYKLLVKIEKMARGYCLRITKYGAPKNEDNKKIINKYSQIIANINNDKLITETKNKRLNTIDTELAYMKIEKDDSRKLTEVSILMCKVITSLLRELKRIENESNI